MPNTTNIATYISQIQTARNTIRAKLVELGLASNIAKLNELATAISGIENKGAVSATVQEGTSYTIPRGYHNGSGSVSGVSGGGNYSLQEKEVTPTKNQQNITSDEGYYGLSAVTVKAIPETYQDVSSVTAQQEDTLTGKIIVLSDGRIVPGTMPNNGTVSKTIDGMTATSVSLEPGYYAGGTVSLTDDIENALSAI